MIASGNGVGGGVGVGTGVTVGVGVGEGVTEGGGLNFGPGHPANRIQAQMVRNAVSAGNAEIAVNGKARTQSSTGFELCNSER